MRAFALPARRASALRAVVSFLAFSLPVASVARADDPLHPLKMNLVSAELIADVAAVAPGTPFRIGVRLRMAEGWHVNWINPGDAGLAPSIAWKLPDGFKAGILQWPLPSRFVTGPLTIFGYAGEVVLMSDVRPPAGLAAGGNIELAADVSWLACAEECVPGSATVRLTLPVEAKPRSEAEQLAVFETTEARLPRHAVTWNVDAHIDESTTLVLDIQNGAASGAPLDGVFFFPYEPGLIENAAPQPMLVQSGPVGESVYQLRVERARIPAGALTQVQGVLVASAGLASGAGPSAIEISVPVNRR